MDKQNPIDALKNCGKKPGLQIWVLRTVKPQARPLAHLFPHAHQQPELEYEVFTLSPTKHGIFFTEDLYIILKTHEDSRQRDIHFWFGQAYKDTPPPWIDKFEDLSLDWPATQHFEFQGYECQLFESYFQKIQPAIRYKRGRNPEPFAERLRGETRFYKLECLDKAHYRVKEIPFNIALMTKEECFILDTDYNTRTYLSDRTLSNERNKSIIVANRIREQDHEGNGDVEVVDLTTFNNDHDRQAYAKTAKLLEEQEQPPLKIDYDQPDDDPSSSQVKLSAVTLMSSEDIDIGYPPRFKYVPRPKKVAKEEKKSFFGRVKKRWCTSFRRMLGYDIKSGIEYEIPALEEKFIKQAVSKPYKHENLCPSKCYMLEGSVGQSVFLWVGKSCELAGKIELTECLRLETRRCEQYNQNDNEAVEIDTNAYTKNDKKVEGTTPSWTHVIKVVQGKEPVKFKKYFVNWN